MSSTFSMILAVAGGGALGAVLRYLTATTFLSVLGPRFPWGTLTVNIIGSALMGIAAGYFAKHYADTAPALRAFIMVGVLGGFTTFSAFSMDVSILLERVEGGFAAAYVLGSVMVSLLALFAGLSLVRLL